MYTSSDHENWHALLPFLAYVYNGAVQNTIRFSSFFLVYNREAPSAIDLLLFYTNYVCSYGLVAEAVSRPEKCSQLAFARKTQP